MLVELLFKANSSSQTLKKKTTKTYCAGDPWPGFEPAQQCAGVKPVNGIPVYWAQGISDSLLWGHFPCKYVLSDFCNYKTIQNHSIVLLLPPCLNTISFRRITKIDSICKGDNIFWLLSSFPAIVQQCFHMYVDVIHLFFYTPFFTFNRLFTEYKPCFWSSFNSSMSSRDRDLLD